jgi:UDP-N-acetylmuramate dehydrogenase
LDFGLAYWYARRVTRLREWQAKINISGELRENEPLATHTTFQVGGPADLYAVPETTADLTTLLQFADREHLPRFILGGGANVLVSDRGVRGLVIDMVRFSGVEHSGTRIIAGAGAAISEVSAYAADHALAGLDFIYAMPGSVGGAVWMNARCYDGEIFPILGTVNALSATGEQFHYTPQAEEFGYKRSPFMTNDWVMTRVEFALSHGEPGLLWEKMRDHEADRRAKGHFAAPCAGSVFKNNRAYGRPSGAIIDSIGLRGYSVGGAKVSDEHANIVVNTGTATATEIRTVIEHVHDRVLEELGFDLEPEVLFVGDWGH